MTNFPENRLRMQYCDCNCVIRKFERSKKPWRVFQGRVLDSCLEKKIDKGRNSVFRQISFQSSSRQLSAVVINQSMKSLAEYSTLQRRLSTVPYRTVPSEHQLFTSQVLNQYSKIVEIMHVVRGIVLQRHTCFKTVLTSNRGVCLSALPQSYTIQLGSPGKSTHDPPTCVPRDLPIFMYDLIGSCTPSFNF